MIEDVAEGELGAPARPGPQPGACRAVPVMRGADPASIGRRHPLDQFSPRESLDECLQGRAAKCMHPRPRSPWEPRADAGPDQQLHSPRRPYTAARPRPGARFTEHNSVPAQTAKAKDPLIPLRLVARRTSEPATPQASTRCRALAVACSRRERAHLEARRLPLARPSRRASTRPVAHLAVRRTVSAAGRTVSETLLSWRGRRMQGMPQVEGGAWTEASTTSTRPLSESRRVRISRGRGRPRVLIAA